MAKPCKPENKYPPKPCPCPEIPGPPGPTGPQGPKGDDGVCPPCPGFNARINPGDDQSGAFFTAVPIGGTGPFTYLWSNPAGTGSLPLASTYIGLGAAPQPQELAPSVPFGTFGEKIRVTASLQNSPSEGMIVCEITDTGVTPNQTALAYHYVKIYGT